MVQRQGIEQSIKADWAVLLLPVCLQHKVQQELRLIEHKRAAARQTLTVLQKLLSSVQASQHTDAQKQHAHLKRAQIIQEKQASYRPAVEKMRQKLEKNGFDEEVRVRL